METLAKLLGGELSCSRGVVDEGGLPYVRQAGQSGRADAPKRYLAVGISSVNMVIAINSDPDAPILAAVRHCGRSK